MEIRVEMVSMSSARSTTTTEMEAGEKEKMNENEKRIRLNYLGIVLDSNKSHRNALLEFLTYQIQGRMVVVARNEDGITFDHIILF